MATCKKSSSACCGLTFDATDLPHSSFEPLYPKVFRGTPEVDLVSTVWRPGQTVNFCLQHVTHILKAIGLPVNLVYLGTLYLNPVTRQIFRNIVVRNWQH